MDCSPPGSSIHGMLGVRILEWVAISFSRGSSWPRDQTLVSGTAGRFFPVWATREAQKWWLQNDYCLWLMLKLKLQSFSHLMWRADSMEKTLMLGKIEGRRRRGWQRMRWLDGITNSMDQWTWVSVNSRSWWWTMKPGVQHLIGSQRVGHDWVTEMNWVCSSVNIQKKGTFM